tara:strand:- start:214 stop:357 length:144 start_codon:yes stop_codon:yes gene_type:complete
MPNIAQIRSLYGIARSDVDFIQLVLTGRFLAFAIPHCNLYFKTWHDP